MAGFDENFFFCNRPFNAPPYRSISIGRIDDSLLKFVRHFGGRSTCVTIEMYDLRLTQTCLSQNRSKINRSLRYEKLFHIFYFIIIFIKLLNLHR